jgi:hypothetical protein
MTAKIHLPTQSLYDQDFNLWLSATVQQLRDKRFEEIDLENLIEEIESMGRSDQRSLKNFLIRLLEHLIKITYWESERDRCARGWRKEIGNFRSEIEDLLKDSPSLKPLLEELFGECYRRARRSVSDESGIKNIPNSTDWTLAQVINLDWFPIDIEDADDLDD